MTFRLYVAILLAAVPFAFAGPSASVSDLAKQIDQVVEAKLKALEQAPRAGIDDYTFARRAHLDLVGRIPTYDELKQFSGDKKPNKRARLISKLLKSKGYNSHFYNYWADLLRVKTIGDQLHHAGNFTQAIKAAVRENKPYDDMARELVAARGKLYEKGNGFAGFKAREVMHLDRVANTAKTFLGLGIDCAQCHDHPFDDWTQKEFYELAAFSSGVKLRVEPPALLDRSRYSKIRQKLKNEDFDTWIVYRESLRMKYANIEGNGTGYQRLPHDYQYKDGEAHQVMAAQVLYGETPSLDYKVPLPAIQKHKNNRYAGPPINSLDQLAEWMSSSDNAMFNRTTVNRLWKWVMGSELVGPLGDLKLVSEGKHPELTATLIDVLKTVDYDVRAFYEVLLNSKTYQSRALPLSDEPPAYILDGPLVRRMSAQVAYDSLLTLRVANPDRFVPTTFFYDGFTHFNEKTQDWSAEDFETFSRDSNLTRGGLSRVAHKEAAARNPDPGQPHERRASESEHVAHGTNLGYVEFSKLFGASTRELIDGANTDPNIPQVLYLMNGKVDESLRMTETAVMKRVLKTPPPKRIDRLWRSIYSRPITPEEAGIVARTGQTQKGLEDLAWALVNANEFRYIR